MYFYAQRNYRRTGYYIEAPQIMKPCTLAVQILLLTTVFTKTA